MNRKTMEKDMTFSKCSHIRTSNDGFTSSMTDIILKLSWPANLGRKVNTICLQPHGPWVKLGTKCFVTGDESKITT